MTLGEKQRLFSRLLPRLLDRAHELGFEVALGQAERSLEEQMRLNRAGLSQIRNPANGAHVRRLAIDLYLYRAGTYLVASEHYAPLGEWWETVHPLCAWGGRFSRPDGNHFSLTHEGVR